MLLGFSLNAHQLRIVFALFVSISTAFGTIPAHAELVSFQITKIDSDCTYYATFWSHNQKVVQNSNGIFLTYSLTRMNDDPWATAWRLLRSTDGGQNFSIVFESSIGSNAPAIATDENNNLFLTTGHRADPKDPVLLYLFDASSNYTSHTTTRVDYVGGMGKYAMVYDEVRKRVFIMNMDGQLYIFDSNTIEFISSKIIMNASGPNVYPQYPHLSLGTDGVLHHAWTTEIFPLSGEGYYWDIHYVKSPDGGITWQKIDGTTLTTPFNPDDSGPADQIILNDEFTDSTWLSNMLTKNGKVHLTYQASELGRQHYVRIDLEAGLIDKRVYPTWYGDTITFSSMDCFFATRSNDPNSPIILVAYDWPETLIALISWDNGDTWSDLATTDFPATHNVWAIGGSAEITDDGYVIGSFTDMKDKEGELGGDPYFFRLPIPYIPPNTGATSGECASFNLSMLHVPCVDVGGVSYWADLQLSNMPVPNTFHLANHGVNSAIATETGNCGLFDLSTSNVHIPCIDMGGGTTYWLELQSIPGDSDFLLDDYGEN